MYVYSQVPGDRDSPTRVTARLLLTGVLMFAGHLHAGEAPLTLAEAQRLAVERSRQLDANDAVVLASRELAVSAAQNPDPVLRLGVDNLPVDGPDRFSIGADFMTMRRIGVMQEFTRAEKRQLRGQRYEREADKAVAEKSVTLADIHRDTALAWFDRYYAEAMAMQMAEQIRQAQLEIEAADSAYRSGRGSQAEVFVARAAKVALEDRASELDRKVRTATTALARWVGSGAQALLGAKPATDTVPFHIHALDIALARHPRIDVLAKQVEVAATEAKLAQANKKSDWSAEVAFSQRGSQYSNMVSFGVSIPLQWDRRNRQDREVAAKLSQVERARAEREEALRAHVAEVSAMLGEWENTRARQARIEREMVPLAAGRTQAAMSAYRGGKSSLTDALGARRSEIEVRLQALQLELEAARLWAQLAFLLPPDESSLRPATPAASSASFGGGVR